MRGALSGRVSFSLTDRIIPADAGSTSNHLNRTFSPWDHPRRCGEHLLSFTVPLQVTGSSPQMRGAQSGDFPARPVFGIIPADAGSTPPGDPHTCDHADYPRRCGEHQAACGGISRPRGSSPQMRGAPGESATNVFRLRDHPRRCGEHFWGQKGLFPLIGSSPQMRGAPALRVAVITVDGIIPADAGSTLMIMGLSGTPQDHPRRCGEHIRAPALIPLRLGSSPQMRGARPPKCGQILACRIIPADAGSTEHSEPCRLPTEDHPRRCGEHPFLYVLVPCPGGSSPQMRGARNPSRGHRHHRRIIPADAGSTYSGKRFTMWR